MPHPALNRRFARLGLPVATGLACATVLATLADAAVHGRWICNHLGDMPSGINSDSGENEKTPCGPLEVAIGAAGFEGNIGGSLFCRTGSIEYSGLIMRCAGPADPTLRRNCNANDHMVTRTVLSGGHCKSYAEIVLTETDPKKILEILAKLVQGGTPYCEDPTKTVEGVQSDKQGDCKYADPIAPSTRQSVPDDEEVPQSVF